MHSDPYEVRQINVSVVGMSGNEKGVIGVGKSCICNRFVRPLNSDYFTEHISVISQVNLTSYTTKFAAFLNFEPAQSDFNSRCVNNDHFLYWGDVCKTSNDGVDYLFRVIEQTEFVDDVAFQPFNVGNIAPYVRRCTSTKIVSAEKLMYICKNQLGMEEEYERRVMPDGRLTIDGFICVFDVSAVPNRSIAEQVKYVSAIISRLLIHKKPLVLVTTKNDEANDCYIREAKSICQRKDYKGKIHMVETSSHEDVNIDLAFLVLAQMIDKSRSRDKIRTYGEEARRMAISSESGVVGKYQSCGNHRRSGSDRVLLLQNDELRLK